jgi:hypothetical protein
VNNFDVEEKSCGIPFLFNNEKPRKQYVFEVSEWA